MNYKNDVERLAEALRQLGNDSDARMIESMRNKILNLEDENEHAAEIINAVAHVGVDFGYGEITNVSEETIKMARDFMDRRR